MKQGMKLNVFAIRRVGKEGVIWTKAGSAWINRDGSMGLILNVLPMDGELHVREEKTEKDERSAETQSAPVETNNTPSLEADAAASMGGH